MTERKWECPRDHVVILAVEQPRCPICNDPMPEEARQAAVTRRLGRCCLKGKA